MPTFDDALRSLDDAFRSAGRDRHIPGVSWGVVRDGELAHVGATGTIRDGETRQPDEDTVYRIASMTKSFTAAAILLLRDEGRLRLDDPVRDWVPALTGWRGPTADAVEITIRQLLTMSAGLPTDDPWGDRQQGLPLDAFDALLREGPPFAWPSGTTFEYSNLGYGILGRVVTAAAGAEYRHVVRDRLLQPLGMTSSGFGEEEIPLDRLAHGYARDGDRLVREGRDVYGALASMGGVYSTVRDLARWVGGFLDAFPARDDPETGHPLRRASRREMQQAHRVFPASSDAHPAHEAPVLEAGGYGFGLWTVTSPEVGTTVGHGGGYPGYGSMMAWHPASGLGVVALGNLRYAGVHDITTAQLAALVRAEGSPRRVIRPHPAIEPAVRAVSSLLERWDDAAADALFAMNMDLDQPRERRRAAVAQAVEAVVGPLRPDPDRPTLSRSPLHRRWWLRGQRGWLEVGVRLSPEPSPRLQAWGVTAVVEPSAALTTAVAGLLEAAEGGRWPAGLPAADGVDRALVMRGLRALVARSGPLAPGHVLAGDGATTVTLDVGATPGVATLKVVLDPTTGAVAAAEPAFAAREAPPEAW